MHGNTFLLSLTTSLLPLGPWAGAGVGAGAAKVKDKDGNGRVSGQQRPVTGTAGGREEFRTRPLAIGGYGQERCRPWAWLAVGGVGRGRETVSVVGLTAGWDNRQPQISP